ncbi:MAG: group 1 glycosyl transferase, partial [Bacteroidota bacterium]
VPTVGAPLEIVREGQEGFQRDMRELDTVVEALKRWSNDRPLFEQMQQAALRRAADFRRERFDREIVAEAGACLQPQVAPQAL